VSISLSIDAVINLLRSGQVQKREKLFMYLRSLADHSDRLAQVWIEICTAAKKTPGEPWNVPDLTSYFERVEPGNSLQKYVYVSMRQMYRSLSVAMAGRLDKDAMEVIANKAGWVLHARTLLRWWYEHHLLSKKALRQLPTDEEITEMEKLLEELLERVADLRAVIAAAEAKA
jgi:hypothetical protein